eukprot:7658618-Pyramimonas_sp.AAC.1
MAARNATRRPNARKDFLEPRSSKLGGRTYLGVLLPPLVRAHGCGALQGSSRTQSQSARKRSGTEIRTTPSGPD